MRKTAIVMLVLVTALVFGLPQYCSAQGVSFGLKGGINMAKLTGSDAGTNSMKTGFVAGAFTTVDMVFLNIQPEILFSQKGATYEVFGLSIDENHNYLEIPVLFKFPLGKIVVPSIYVGPSLGMLMSADVEGFDIKDGLKSTDLGLVFGMDVKTPVKLILDARYTMGLTSIDDSGIYDVKNSAISLMVGYAIF